MKAIIFNSGIGSRMKELTTNSPKCLVRLYNGETIFERQIRILSECGINDFIITTGPFQEQIISITNKYKNLKFTFIENPQYKTTNYIVSMNYAYDFLDDDFLLLHGDLVFNKRLVKNLLENENKSVCLYNEEKSLSDKDFKARFINNTLKEVSISIFDNCYAFQPLYKLAKEDLTVWKNKVSEFVKAGITNVYAENALNEITDEITIKGLSYKNDYIDEIDNEDDFIRVSKEIREFDINHQEILETNNYINEIKQKITKKDKIFIVCGNNYYEQLKKNFSDYNITFFKDSSPNPKFEEIQDGLKLFKTDNFNIIISIGGGSKIDSAKCIKAFSSLNNEYDFLEKKYVYNNIKHIAIPTTAGTGSESTQFAVMYYQNQKFSIDCDMILPDLVILDYNLLKSLPDYQKKATLLDALCQSIESYWAKNSTLESKVFAQKSISLILNNYKNYLKNDEKASYNMLIASNYSGKAINISKTTAAHAMSYKLTQNYGIAHGHAVALCIIPIWKLLYEKSENNLDLRSNLNEIAEIFNCNSIIENINLIINIINEFNLPQITIKSQDLDILTNSVNIERLNNNPVIFSKEEIYNIYKNL